MLFGIIKNLDRTYEYLFKCDDELVSYHISEKGFCKSDKSYINSIISKFKFNKEYEYLTKFREYDVYYDSLTELKHFLINGKEDYDMLFKYNGKDACLYSDNDNVKSIVKTFIIGGLTAILSVSGFQFLMKTNYNMNADISAYVAHSPYDLIKMYEYEPISYNDAINSINNSDFPSEAKKVIANEDLLKLIFSYYKGSSLEYTAHLKFDNLRIETFGKEHTSYNEINGFYDPTEPNVIHIKDTLSINNIQVIIHEFIHLLQAEGSLYLYINEAVAELMTSELLGIGPLTYRGAVNNLKLLINTVGPEVIYEMSFGGDDNKFNEILDTYLSKKDSMALKYYLTTSGQSMDDNKELHINIENILNKLYKNMYGYDISENKEILNLLTSNGVSLGNVVVDKRTFLVPNKMKETENIFIFSPDMEALAQNNLVDKKTYYVEHIKIENAAYENILNSSNVEFKEIYNDDQYIAGEIITEKENIYYRHLDNPIKIEEYNMYTFENYPSRKYSIGQAIDKGYVGVYEVIYSDEKNNENQKEYTCYVSKDDSVLISSDRCDFIVKGIKTRFSEQYENLIERINNESYHK